MIFLSFLPLTAKESATKQVKSYQGMCPSYSMAVVYQWTPDSETYQLYQLHFL